MDVDGAARANWRVRWSNGLDRAEAVYLKILRAAVLLVATGLIAIAIWLGINGLIKLSRSPASVVEKEAAVSADDLVNAPVVEEQRPESREGQAPVPTAATRNAYRDRLNRYFEIYRSRFEPYRQAEDKQLSRDEFDDQYLRTNDRAMSVATGSLNEQTDLAELDRLIAVVGEAAASAKTVEALNRYKRARKVPVRKSVEKFRTELRQGWDSNSTACDDWYYRPYGCPAVRAVSVPYTEQVTVMEFPKGTRSHAAIFNAYHQRYNELLADRRMDNATEAELERQSILEGKIEGGAAIWTAIQIAVGFVVLMFFFLLIAIERHQRKQAVVGSVGS
ncbi:MAG: hypothetical protein M3Q19_14370 [Pseudomonadota bacterium]|nr:hypothetical protein [Pseudomonadota bacterium]